jgi:hypothetical protein
MTCPQVIKVVTPGPPGPVGPTGPAGVGAAWLQDAGAPGAEVGSNGDFYLNTTTGDIYGPKAAGAWGSVIFNIAEGQQGPAGPAGATGPQGPQGIQGETGPQGPQGPAGPTGPAGADGADGADGTGFTILGTVATVGELPGSASAGDAYLVSGTGDIYVWSGTAWVNLGPLQGPQGPAGPTGPAGADGADGADGAQGPAGPAGADGAPGAAGADGADGIDGRTILSGIGAPGSGTGEDGDFYIDVSASEIYGPKVSGAWGLPTSLIGPAGADGADGADGATGPQGPQGETGPAGPTGPAGADGADGADATYSDATPQALGATAAAGTAASASRSDHVHQRDSDVIVVPVGDESSSVTAGTNKVRFRMPFAATLLEVRANVNTAPTGSTLIVDINEGGTSVLGTKLSIDAGETTSTTADAAATITDTALADDAEISIDIDQIGSTVAGAGLKVSLFVRRS